MDEGLYPLAIKIVKSLDLHSHSHTEVLQEFLHLLFLDDQSRGSDHNSLVEIKLFSFLIPDLLRDHLCYVLSDLYIGELKLLPVEVLPIEDHKHLMVLVSIKRHMEGLFHPVFILQRRSEPSTVLPLHKCFRNHRLWCIEGLIKLGVLILLLELLQLRSFGVKWELDGPHSHAI